MAAGSLPKDNNFVSAIGGTSSASDLASTIRPFQYNPSTRGMLVHIVGDDVGGGGGGGTQYTDGGAAAAHPIGTGIIFNDGGTYTFVSDTTPLPIAGSFSVTNPTIGVAVPATANYIAGNKAGNLTGLLFGSQTTTNSLAVALASDQVAIPVTGTFWQTTQPVSLASVPSHAVTNAGTFAVQVDGAALTALQLIDNLVLAEDAVAASGDPGIQVLAVRASAPANTSSTNGDYEPLQINGGRLWTSATIDAALPAGTNAIGKLAANSGVDIGDVDVTSALITGSTTAHDAADANNPIKIGGYAINANRNRVANGDRTDLIADLAGRLITNLGQVRELRGKQTTTISASTSEITIVTAAASTYKDLVSIIISNTSATGVRVDIRDTTAGTVLFSLYVPATDTRGFSLPGSAIPQTAVNTNWTAQSSASVTDLRILAIFENNT